MPNNIYEYGVEINVSGNYGSQLPRLSNFFSGFNKNLSQMSAATASRLNRIRTLGSAFANFGTAASNAFGKMYNMSNQFLGSLFNLKSLIIGGGLTMAIRGLARELYGVGIQMEQSFARMWTSLGSKKKTQEVLAWAAKKTVETPFELPDINEMMATLSMFGKAKDTKTLDKYFSSIGNFAAAKALTLNESTMMLLRASMGNWMWMRRRLGIAAGNLMDVAKGSAHNREELIKLVQVINKAKAGTKQYADAVMNFFDMYAKGGMERMVKTVAGTVSNITDLFNVFKIKLLGYSQVEGTFFNTLQKGLLSAYNKVYSGISEYHVKMKDGSVHILKMLSQERIAMLESAGAIVTKYTYADKFFELARRLGKAISILWTNVDKALGGIADMFAQWIDRVTDWFRNFRGHVAPLIVYLTLVKYKVKDFWKGFKEGFMSSFGFFWSIMKGFFSFAKFIFGGSTLSTAEGMGKALGGILGSLIGIKATGFMLKIPVQTISAIKTMASCLGNVLRSAGGIASAVGGIFGGSFGKILQNFGGGVSRFGKMADYAMAQPVRVVNWAEARLAGLGGPGGGGGGGTVTGGGGGGPKTSFMGRNGGWIGGIVGSLGFGYLGSLLGEQIDKWFGGSGDTGSMVGGGAGTIGGGILGIKYGKRVLVGLENVVKRGWSKVFGGGGATAGGGVAQGGGGTYLDYISGGSKATSTGGNWLSKTGGFVKKLIPKNVSGMLSRAGTVLAGIEITRAMYNVGDFAESSGLYDLIGYDTEADKTLSNLGLSNIIFPGSGAGKAQARRKAYKGTYLGGGPGVTGLGGMPGTITLADIKPYVEKNAAFAGGAAASWLTGLAGNNMIGMPNTGKEKMDYYSGHSVGLPSYMRTGNAQSKTGDNKVTSNTINKGTNIKIETINVTTSKLDKEAFMKMLSDINTKQ